MTRNEVVHKVKSLLEELSPFEEPSALLAVPNNDVKPIESYIQDTLDKAFDTVLMSVPLYLVRTTTKTPQTISVTVEDGVGYMDEPIDFLRLHTMMVDGWSRPVKGAISSENPIYLLQRDRYTRGGMVKPVVAVNDGKIELYSVPEDPDVTIFKYIPRTPANTQNFEDSLCDFLVHQDAIDILRIFEQFDKVSNLEKKLQELIIQQSV